MAKNPLLLASTLAVLVFTGCAQDDGDTQSSDPSLAESSVTADPSTPDPSTPDPSTPEASTPEASAGGEGDEQAADAAPETLDFTGTLVSGEAFEGASLAGRPTLLWFWAPWCPTCRGQIPQVEGLAAEHADELNVIGVGSLDSSEAIADFAGDVDEVVHLEDVDGELWKRFGVTEQSSFVLLDADGAVVFEAGYGGTDDLDSQVDDILG